MKRSLLILALILLIAGVANADPSNFFEAAPDASTTVPGMIEIADDTEAAAGVATDNTTLFSKNNILQDNSTNISVGGDYTHNQTTNATSGVTFATDGYHLASTDTGVIDNGTDLSSDSVFPFDDDIDGDTRSGDWDIGCDEYIPSTWTPKVIIY